MYITLRDEENLLFGPSVWVWCSGSDRFSRLGRAFTWLNVTTTTNVRNHKHLLNSYHLVQWFQNCWGQKIKYFVKIFTIPLFWHLGRPKPLARPMPLSSPGMPLCRLTNNCVESLGHECTDVVGENWTLHFHMNLLVTHALTYVSHSTKTSGFKHLLHSEVGGAGSRPPDRVCLILHRKMSWWTALFSFFTPMNYYEDEPVNAA